MVESAMEFLRICENLNYHEIILSMKASNTQVMVQAYRLLVKRMNKEDMSYPLHFRRHRSRGWRGWQNQICCWYRFIA